MTVDSFFAFARARHEITLRRASGAPGPWTADPILLRYKFTNVFREMDRTTLALRRMTDTIRSDPEVLLFTVAMRWFCRIETWQTMMGHRLIGTAGSLNPPIPAASYLAQMMDESDGRAALRAHLILAGAPPWITGAYIVQTETGLDKLSGVFSAIGKLSDRPSAWRMQQMMRWREVADMLLAEPGQHSLQAMQFWLLGHDRMGPFMAYEVVTDLRHTGLLDQAPDIMTWANAGPGAMRGLNRIHGRPLKTSQHQQTWCKEMRDLLMLAPGNWPDDWPKLEMREIEHTLCEFDKYERVRLGEGAPRNLFRPSPLPLP